MSTTAMIEVRSGWGGCYKIILWLLCIPGLHHRPHRYPSQDGRPETWRGEGYASNSKGGQGTGREEGPWSTEHLSLRFSGSRGPSCSSEGLKPSKVHVTVAVPLLLAHSFSPPPPQEVSTAIQATWLDSPDMSSVLTCCPGHCPFSSRTTGMGPSLFYTRAYWGLKAAPQKD